MKRIYYILYFLFASFLFCYYIVIESPIAPSFNPFDGKFIWLMHLKVITVAFFADTALFLLFATLVIADLKKGKKVFPLNFASLVFANVGNILHVYLFAARTANLVKANSLFPPGYFGLSKIYFYGVATAEVIISAVLLIKMIQALGRKRKQTPELA